MNKDNRIMLWGNDPETMEAAIMSLTTEERAAGLAILRKLKDHILTNTKDGHGSTEWDDCTAPALLEAFEDAEELPVENQPTT